MGQATSGACETMRAALGVGLSGVAKASHCPYTSSVVNSVVAAGRQSAAGRHAYIRESVESGWQLSCRSLPAQSATRRAAIPFVQGCAAKSACVLRKNSLAH